MTDKLVINVNIERREGGYYLGTSPDLKGLLVCSKSFINFSQEIPEAIKLLLKAKFETDVDVEEMVSVNNSDVSHVVFQATSKIAA